MSFINSATEYQRSLPGWIPCLSVVGLTVLALAHPSSVQAQSDPLVEQCNQFAATVNQNAEILAEFESEITMFSQNASQAETLDQVKSAAQQYVDAVAGVTDSLDGLVGDLAALSLADGGLSAYRDQYVTVVEGFSAALTQVSNAMTGVAETQSEAELNTTLGFLQSETDAAAGQLDQLSVQETSTIEGVNTYCGTTP